jgi:putative iron-dependent peroxidase
MFVGFSAPQEPLQKMLRSMAGIDSPRDALTRYASPSTGSFYFVPSFDDLVDSTTV